MTSLDSSFELHIFGQGQDRPRIEQMIDRLNIGNRVTMHGPTLEPQSAMGMIDLLVLPSEAEGFGLVLIEAMAARVPVVATNVPGIRDVVEDHVTGLLVPVATPAAIADAILRIESNSKLRSRLVENALTHVKATFSWEAVLPHYRALLDQS